MGLRHDGINVPGKHRKRQRPDRDNSDENELQDLTVDELRDLARGEEINLHGADTKDEIVSEIENSETDPELYGEDNDRQE